MKDPILSREQVLKITHDVCAAEDANYYKFGEKRLLMFAAAIEAAVLERVCGEPIYQVWIEETSSYADVTAEYYAERLPSNRRIAYAINWSKT